MKPPGPMQRFVAAMAVVCVVGGAVCLGLGLSALDYIRYEQAHGHSVPGSTVHGTVMCFVVGAGACLAGIVLWRLGRRPVE